MTAPDPRSVAAGLSREQTIEAVQTLLERGKATLDSDGYLTLVRADRASIRAEAFEEAAIPVNVLLQWIDEAWPDSGSGSDFNQGVQRGFEIIKAQLENGHILAYSRALATKEPSDGRP